MENRLTQKISSEHAASLSYNLSSLSAIKCRLSAACLLLFAFCLLPFAFYAQDTEAKIAAGRKLFNSTCSSGYCHGKDGSVSGAPPLRGRRYSADYLMRVISDGVPGTAMGGFKDYYNKEELQQLVAYVMSLSKGESKTASTTTSTEPGANPAARKPTANAEPAKSSVESPSADPLAVFGSIEAGRTIFFDSTQEKSCGACHTFQGRGGKLGPDLSNIGNRTARELLQSIIIPQASIDPAYVMLAVTTRDSERIVGIKRDEDDEMIKVMDISTLPAVSRTIQKSNIAKVEKLRTSAMPGDYASRYTLKQLLDLITFLKSSGPASERSVSLKDLF